MRGQSCSLVDIPTYLATTVELGSVAGELDKAVPIVSLPVIVQQQKNRSRWGREGWDGAGLGQKEAPSKSQWAVLGVAVLMITMCISMVGFMMHYTTDYQNKIILARFANFTATPDGVVTENGTEERVDEVKL